MIDPLHSILDFIQDADSDQLSQIVQAVVHQYTQIAPDWESVSLSLPKKDLEMRKTYLKTIMEFLEKNKK